MSATNTLTPVIRINEDKCINCYACITACPVKLCMDGSGKKLSINPDSCIGCGNCIGICSHNARQIIDDTQRFFDELEQGAKIVAIVAPAIASFFPGKYLNFNGYLKSLGVEAAFDVSFGAELAVASYIDHIKKNPKMVICQPCPAIVNFIQIYCPKLLPYLAPVDSPMLHTIKMIREYYPRYRDHKVAIISPCVAKRREFDETGLGDYNVTMFALKAKMEERNLNVGFFPQVEYVGPHAERAVRFSSPGGLLEVAERFMPGIGRRTLKIEGVHVVYPYLEEVSNLLETNIRLPMLIDCLNCEKGCNGGPGTGNGKTPMVVLDNPIRERSDKLEEYHKTGKSQGHTRKYHDLINRYWKEGLYRRSYRNHSANNKLELPNEKQLVEVYGKLRKHKAEDIYDCTACGYGSCKMMAIAIFNKLNKPENCAHHNLDRLAEEKRITTEMNRRLEAANTANRSKSVFLAKMSHEIRTPLTAVLGVAEIQLQDSTLNPNVEEAFAKIHNSANTLLGIVNDILDLSKIEAGRMSLVSEKYELASMISDVVQLHLLYISGDKIRFHLYVDENLPAFLVGDELRVKQVLSNLLTNAFKYTEAGTVEMTLRCEKDGSENGTILAVSISDTGIGMTKQQVESLYDEYSRFHEHDKRLIGGTGLGMPIVYNILQMMGGKIEVESEPNKGTDVLVRIPQKTAGREVLGRETAQSLEQFEVRAASAAKRFQFAPEPMPYGRVLVVDDVDANLYVAQGLLLFYDLNIETCESGYAAIDKVKRGEVYDIIFMDHMMPKMDGAETTRILRAMGYSNPIVAITANALIGQAEEFMRNGFDGFLSKPIQTMHLNTILTKFIRDRQTSEVIEAAKAAAGDRPQSFADGGIEGYLDRPEVAAKLRRDFIQSQGNAIRDITRALEAGDFKTAHRVAHTLKGLAGIIKEKRLAKASAELEKLLVRKENSESTRRHIRLLRQELDAVLNSPPPEPESFARPVPNKAKTKELLDRLAESLAEHSAENLGIIENLKGLPEAAILVKQVEEFDFDMAAKTLVTLREVLGL